MENSYQLYRFQIPFPAITICSESKTNVDKFNLSEVIRKIDNNETLSQEDSMKFEAIYQVCEIMVNKTDEAKCNVVQTLRDVANGFADLSSAQIARIPKSFKQIFRETMTGEGICYTFNMLNHKDLFKKNLTPALRFPKESPQSNWTVFGYNNNEPITYPVRVLGSGKKAGISISLKMRQKDVDYACKEVANGFRLAFHTPDELPRTASYFYRIPFNVETTISLEPRVMTTSKSLEHYKPKKRQCYFAGEKRLTFFKAYTQSNCKLECLTGKFHE
jgi:acid-sensing ion channel, other